MKLTVALGLASMLVTGSLAAQENLVGKYAGTFNLQTQSRGVLPIPISLQITSAANGKLQATASRGHNNKAGQGCAGEYKLTGSYEGNKIDLKSDAGGPAGDCVMHLQLVAEGNKLKGTMGKSEVEFSR